MTRWLVFFVQDVYPKSTNPYVPWNPIGVILGPLGLIALVFGRRKKGSKVGTFLVLVLVVGSVGMTLAGCGPAPIPTQEPTQEPTIPPASETPVPSETPGPTQAPSPTDPPAPNYVPEASTWGSQNSCGCNVWNFSNWETIPGLTFDKWLLALQTYVYYCSADSSEKNIFWPEESQLSLRLILAHNIIKEFGDMLLYADYGNYKKTQEAQEEAYGRQYWQHCGPAGCFMSNGIADSRLINCSFAKITG